MKATVWCLAVFAPLAFSPAISQANLLVNGDFSNGLTGWTIWTQRNDGGNFNIQVNNGILEQRGNSYNGGVYQVVNVPPNVPLSIDGFWSSTPSVPSEQWAEVIVLEGNNPPQNNVDVLAPLIYKNDTFGGSVNGWSGIISQTSPVTFNPTGGPLGAGSPSGVVTVLLKSGSIGVGTLNGANFDNIVLIPEPSTTALALAALLAAVSLSARRHRRTAATYSLLHVQ